MKEIVVGGMNKGKVRHEAGRPMTGEELVETESITMRHGERRAQEEITQGGGSSDKKRTALCEGTAPLVTHQVSTKQ